jgi:hypothetical protein
MAESNEGSRERRVASGFPDPENVPGPTERLRELHGNAATEPQPPKYGRASAATAATDDYVSIDDMLGGSGGSPGGAADRFAAFARRVGDEATERVKDELDRRGVAEKAKEAGIGIGQASIAGVLGLAAVGATATAMVAGMSRVMPLWAAALVTAGVFGLPAGILAADGLARVSASARAMGTPATC